MSTEDITAVLGSKSSELAFLSPWCIFLCESPTILLNYLSFNFTATSLLMKSLAKLRRLTFLPATLTSQYSDKQYVHKVIVYL